MRNNKKDLEYIDEYGIIQTKLDGQIIRKTLREYVGTSYVRLTTSWKNRHTHDILSSHSLETIQQKENIRISVDDKVLNIKLAL